MTRLAIVLVALSACSDDAPAHPDGAPPDAAPDAIACADTMLELPAQILDPTTLHANCTYHAFHLSVEAPLVIESGVTISFADDGYFSAHANVDIRGATFTADTKTPGSWIGVSTFPGFAIVMKNLRVEYAGYATGGNTLDGADAAFTVERDSAPILDHLAVAHSGGHGLLMKGDLDPASTSLAFENIARTPVYTGPRWVGTLPAITVGASVGTPSIALDTTGDWASVYASTWVPQPVPFDVLAANGIDMSLGTVTIHQNTLRFVEASSLRVGSNNTMIGDLVADGVTFEPLPPATDWGGITVSTGFSTVTSFKNVTVIGGKTPANSGIEIGYAYSTCSVPAFDNVAITNGTAIACVEFSDDCQTTGCPKPTFAFTAMNCTPVHYAYQCI